MTVEELIEQLNQENQDLENQKVSLTVFDEVVKEKESELQIAVNLRNQYAQSNKGIDDKVASNLLVINELEKRAESEE